MALLRSFRLFSPLLWGVLGFVLGALVILYFWVQSRPALNYWHEPSLLHHRLAELPDLDRASWQDYLAHEETQFAGLQRLIERKTRKTDQPLPPWHRFTTDGKANALGFSTNWNRSFQLPATAPARFAAVLVHGLSDSPYSMRALGQSLAQAGGEIYALRVPGHGLMPGALLNYRWQSAAHAVALTVNAAAATGLPVYLLGYSNGAALALNYALEFTEEQRPVEPQGLILLAPALQVSPLAGFAGAQAAMAYLPGYQNLAWVDIYPEYDPYKYNSFPVRAGKEMYALTQHLSTKLKTLAGANQLRNFPPVLAFMSATDATVMPAAVKTVLLDKLNSPQHELVLFDVNQQAETEGLLKPNHRAFVAQLSEQTQPFALRIISNRERHDRQINELYRPALSMAVQQRTLDLFWPEDTYSLSHVALPFAPQDPINGDGSGTRETVYLGGGGVRGERGAFIVSMDQLSRLRFNPFYDYVVERSVNFLDANLEVND